MPSILTHVGFSDNKPVIDIQTDQTIVRHTITQEPLTLRFDTTQRYCIGWHDLETAESHVCPDSATIEGKYEQCPACQRRTGFNPAFYHATSVSEQQEKRNREPHFLYLAYFTPGVVKVGISYEGRGIARLLEQGARRACILETFPTALIARQYEAKISAQPGMHEHLTARKKRELWSRAFTDSEARSELDVLVAQLSSVLNTTFSSSRYLDLDAYYFFDESPRLADVIDCHDKNLISGSVLGCLGTDILMRNNDQLLSLHLKHFVGYHVELSSIIEEVETPPVQASLF